MKDLFNLMIFITRTLLGNQLSVIDNIDIEYRCFCSTLDQILYMYFQKHKRNFNLLFHLRIAISVG